MYVVVERDSSARIYTAAVPRFFAFNDVHYPVLGRGRARHAVRRDFLSGRCNSFGQDADDANDAFNVNVYRHCYTALMLVP